MAARPQQPSTRRPTPAPNAASPWADHMARARNHERRPRLAGGKPLALSPDIHAGDMLNMCRHLIWASDGMTNQALGHDLPGTCLRRSPGLDG